MSLGKLAVKAYLPIARLMRGVTLGVRAAAFDREGRVFLVRHSYMPGWYLPGGGVEKGEDAAAAIRREMQEEGGLSFPGEPQLFGAYLNRAMSATDHVLLYVCRDAAQDPRWRRNAEIVEAGFFALDALPGGLTAATRRRLDEIAGRAGIGDW
jgi:ADP-ribose pyrophosphatase YjhB (NUDIX family)